MPAKRALASGSAQGLTQELGRVGARRRAFFVVSLGANFAKLPFSVGGEHSNARMGIREPLSDRLGTSLNCSFAAGKGRPPPARTARQPRAEWGAGFHSLN